MRVEDERLGAVTPRASRSAVRIFVRKEAVPTGRIRKEHTTSLGDTRAPQRVGAGRGGGRGRAGPQPAEAPAAFFALRLVAPVSRRSLPRTSFFDGLSTRISASPAWGGGHDVGHVIVAGSTIATWVGGVDEAVAVAVVAL